KDFFYTGYGVHLQYLDSQVAEKVMLHFAKRGIPVLPIHDSFIVHHGYKNELMEVMISSFDEVVSTKGVVKAKKSFLEVRERRGTGEVTTDLDELLELERPYEGYNSRLDRWRKERAGRQARRVPLLMA